MTRARVAMVTAAALLVACSAPWVPSWLRDPRGPIVPNRSFADDALRPTENQNAMVGALRPIDAGKD